MTHTFRRTLTATATTGVLLAATGCFDGSPAEQDPSPTTSASSSVAASGQPRTSASASASGSDRSTATDIRLTVDGRPVDATLNDSAPARDFAELLPLTLEVEDFHQAEKIVDLPRRLSTSGVPEGAAPKSGDLGYYAPWGQLVLYYRDVPYADGIVILGRLADDGDTGRLATATKVTVDAVH
ncbi:cyclophilin-like fold protein [Streptomyces sp. MH13]|uniref:cyclophilin-like fold protein n=1 Tax=Streptomyces sp. MH13 TaxID=3417651 RepID=UPI003CEE4216